MATRARPPREIPFARIERQFTLAPLDLGGPVHPAVTRDERGRYSIRVLVSSSVGSYGAVSERFDYFRVDADGTVTAAPRGYAKDFKPGRITGLDEAVARYAKAVAP